MKNTLYAVLMAITVLSAGAALLTLTSGTTTMQVPYATGALQGHIETSVAGPDGQIKAYVQTDNFILPPGEDCVLKKLFIGSGNTEATNTELCVDNVGTFNKIALLNGSGCSSSSTDTLHTSGSCLLVSGNGLSIATVTVNDDATTAASGDTEPVVTLTNSFSSITGLGTGGNTIFASALVNGTGTPLTTFAKAQTNGGTGVTVNNGDTLNLTWTITTGGTTTIDN